MDWNLVSQTVVALSSIVAPHDGCVDWNLISAYILIDSLAVAPHDGCVDWNLISAYILIDSLASRTPRWVRGLKFDMQYLIVYTNLSHPTMGAWIEIFT